MITYIPKGKALQAMRMLDEEGAQFASELSAHISVLGTDLKRTLEAALRHKLVGCEYRIRHGLKKHMLWFLTPQGVELMARVREAEGVVA